jgi:hypothetical protein
MEQEAIISTEEFLTAPLIDRAVALLIKEFASSRESACPKNVAGLIAESGGAIQLGSRSGPSRADVLRRVAEAWQVLEQARLICRDLDQSPEWWILTDAGQRIRESSDVAGEIKLRLAGWP